MKAYVAVTDSGWYRYLRDRPELDEVNFWQPRARAAFKAVSPGQPFLFKLHWPENYVVGGGFYAHYSELPLSLAWEAFREKNGAATYAEMRLSIEKYRSVASAARDDYVIGCILLVKPFFFDRGGWIAAPGDFAKNIVRGKGYDLTRGPGRELWEAVQHRLQAMMPPDRIGEPESMYGDPVLVRQRLGQGTFRIVVTDTYERRCAVTGEKVLPVLEAAHIRPVSEGGTHRVDNGLLLRSDLHTLLDRGYVTVTPDFRFMVSGRIKDEFHNGEQYFQLVGNRLWVPTSANDRPSKEFLQWHADVVYRG